MRWGEPHSNANRRSVRLVPVGLLAAVQAQVSLQVVLESKAHAADLAGEGLLPGVNHPVVQQPHLELEGLVALAALVRPLLRVRPLVDAQVSRGGEPLAAGLAGVRPHPRVNSLVLLQALLPDEALATDVTDEGLDLGV